MLSEGGREGGRERKVCIKRDEMRRGGRWWGAEKRRGGDKRDGEGRKRAVKREEEREGLD